MTDKEAPPRPGKVGSGAKSDGSGQRLGLVPMVPPDDLAAMAVALVTVLRASEGTQIRESDDIGDFAVELSVRGWAVFPLAGKMPAIPKRAGGRGVLDATTDVGQVVAWWSGRYRGANIGARVPEPLVVVDVDPRNGGHDSVAALVAAHGPLPITLTVLSGRGDGGCHLYLRRPAGRLSGRRLGAGVDLKTAAGYCVVPPSRHPETGQPYQWILADPAVPPTWLVDLLRDRPIPVARPAARLPGGPSVADDFSAAASWRDLLEPHGWRCLDPDGDSDGARWRHPDATAAHSATVRHGCLFVYSTNTPFPVTEAGDARGVTRFRALAILRHGGDLSAAARALRAAS